jgi:Bax protein
MKQLLTFFLLLALALNSYAKGMPNEYYKIKDTKERKNYFFEYIYNITNKENKKILEERSFVKKLLSSKLSTKYFSSSEVKKLTKLKEKYRIKKLYDLKSYMKKIDIIPPSMSLAQAAVESAWGRSRFTKKANNIFGHWTYNPKIGMIPKRRTAGSKHFIRIFNSLQDSMKAYMLNLNRHRAYSSFREKRYQARLKNRNPMGLELSQTMINYSGIGKKYLSILKSVIKKNKLQNYDKRFYQEKLK